MSRLFGAHAVGDVLAAHPEAIRTILHGPQPDRDAARVIEAARAAGIPTRQAAAAELQEHAGGRGGVSIAADIAIASVPTLESLAPTGVVVALDQVTDPHNLGAILRSCAAFGATAVIVPKDHAAPLNDAAIRASAGAAAIVPVVRVTNLARTLGDLHEQGFWACALAAHDATPLWSTDLASMPLVLVLGAEGSGLRPLVRRSCQLAVTIPTDGRIRSLNVSVAAGIVLGEVARQRHATVPR
ncbi:MAG: 23S rRNA (guanosine(2251)-2'-O)-methyltransferase RlmB [Myxococcota bacterium]